MADGPLPRSGMPDDTTRFRGVPDEPMPRRGAPDEPMPRRGMADGPLPRSGMPDDTTHFRGGPDEPMPSRGMLDETMLRRGGPDDVPPRRGTPEGPRPRSGVPGSAPRSGVPRSGVPGSAPRSGVPRGEVPWDSAPRGDVPSGAPRSALPSSGIPAGGMLSIGGPATGRSSVPQYGDDPYRGDPYRGDPARESAYRDGPDREDPDREDPYRDDRTGDGRRRAVVDEPPAVGRRQVSAEPALADEPLSPEAWRRSLESSQGRRPDRTDDRDDWRGGGGAAMPGYEDWSPRDSAREPRQRAEPGGWQQAEREEAARGSATYREHGAGDWRRDLADESDLAEGESRRYGTSGFVPFRSGGSAAVQGSSNLSMTSTSLLVPAGAPDTAAGRAQRASNGWLAPSGSYERRPVGGGFSSGRRSDLLDPDDEEDDQVSGGPLAAVGYTVIWYGVPVVLFVFYMLVVNGGAQTHALDTLAKAAPQFGISLVLSVIVAVGLRWASSSWKAVSVGLAAAVVGGGLATVLSSAITGNSLS
jgi:hypothetical protein